MDLMTAGGPFTIYFSAEKHDAISSAADWRDDASTELQIVAKKKKKKKKKNKKKKKKKIKKKK